MILSDIDLVYLANDIINSNEIHNSRISAIKTDHLSDKWKQTVILFEESLTEAQLTTFHKLHDCVSKIAASEMRAAYKAGFKDGAALMSEVQE